MLVYDEKVPRYFWRTAMVAGVLPSRDSEKEVIVRIIRTNAILKRPVSKLFPIQYTYHDSNQTDKTREQLRWEAAVNGELKRKYGRMLTARILRGRRSLWTLQILIRFNKIRFGFNKTPEIFPSVTRVLSILLTAATSASVERMNSKERVPKVPRSIPGASYAQR